MAQQNLKLEKTIISNKRSNAIIPKNFDKLAKSEDPINQERIRGIYNDLFYKLKKKGKNSHQYIIEQSYGHVFYQNNKLLDNRINRLLDDLNVLNNKLTNAEVPDIKENEVYEDGAFLMAGEGGNPYQDMNTIWIMQEGRKRLISENMYTVVRRALRLSEDQRTGFYYLTLPELSYINDGAHISDYSDLNIEGDDLIIDGTNIELVSAYYEAEFYCEGNEISDTQNLILNDNGASQGQFIVNNEGCRIKFLVDNGTVDEILPEIVDIFINKGEQITQRFVRETIQMNNQAMPTNIQSIYSSNSPGEIFYSSSPGGEEFTVTDYIREWGPYGKFTGIVYAEGRILYRELKPLDNPSSQILNGLPSNSGEGSFWQVINITDVEQTTPYGTKRIFPPESSFWGSLNQLPELQGQFDNLDFRYYKKDYTLNKINLDLTYLGGGTNWFTGDSIEMSGGTYPVYGQPIIRAYNTYYVVLTVKYKKWSFASINIAQQEWFVLYDLLKGGVSTKRRKDLKNASINLNMEYGNGIDRIKWENANKDLIRYIGLQGYGTVGYHTSGIGLDNPFNPNNGGSNFEINSFNTL